MASVSQKELERFRFELSQSPKNERDETIIIRLLESGGSALYFILYFVDSSAYNINYMMFVYLL